MKKRLLTLLIILSMLLTMAPPVAFAENEIHIATAKDLETLAKNCILDSYSKDLTVILDADIDLTGKVQPSIPIFSGIFDGAGHTISGFELALDGYDLGLFRIIASGGYIMNLNVEGYVDPENVRDNIGGIAGSNYGVLENCTFKGNVHGNMHVGGLVGYNYGAIINCTNYATLLGKTNTGGIAGSNEGLILGSTNEGEINTTYETVETSLDNISLLELTSITGVSATDENVVSNTGGIVGASVGVIRSCVNKSQVGYQHYGYNVGGIAGIQSGFVTDCENYGLVLGRKDVGGIVGQMEPYMILIKKDSLVDGLLDLSDSIDETLSNLDENSSVQQQQKSSIKDDIDKAIKDANDYNDKYKVVDVDEQQEQEERKQGVLDELSNLGEQAEKDAKSLDEAVGSENINELLEGNASEETKEESKDSLVEWLRDRVTGNESTSNTQKVVDKVGEDTINNALDGNLTEEDKQALLDVGKEEGLNAAQDLYNNKDGIVDGVKDKINEKKDSNDQEEKDKKTLTTDMENLTGSMTSLASMFSNTANGLSSDLRLVNSNYLEVLTLMANLLSGNYVEFNDISEKDTEKDYDGKVRNSINYGDISGDTNVGGISGEMALEFDYDMEGKYTSTLGDKELVSKTYETRCVARECINRGHVEGKKDNIGGITGNMEVGTIIACENYGPVSADKSTYIGGIVGMSSGTVKSCYAMCSITGEMYIGGIAGKGYKIIDCYTLVEIRGAQSSYGTIAGYADMKLKANLTEVEGNTKLSDTGEEEEDPDCHIKGNFYVHDSVGAINGISYAGFAEPIEYSKLIEDENTPDDFRELKMTYVADGVTVGEVRFIYGEGLDTSLIPNVPFKEGYAGYWPEYDYSQLFFSDTLEAIYTARGVTLETEKHRVDSEMPVVLVEGSFDDASTISFEEYTAGDTPSGTVEAWQLKITGNHDKDNAFVLHYYEPETNLFTRIIIYVLDANGEWQKVAATQSGSYMMLNETGDEMIFAAVKAPSPLFMILAGSAVLILFVALFIALKKKKNH